MRRICIMRLFIAIDLPRSFKAELARIQKEVKGISCGAAATAASGPATST